MIIAIMETFSFKQPSLFAAISQTFFCTLESRKDTEREKEGEAKGKRKKGTNGIQKERTEEEIQMRDTERRRSHRKDFGIEKDRGE